MGGLDDSDGNDSGASELATENAYVWGCFALYEYSTWVYCKRRVKQKWCPLIFALQKHLLNDINKKGVLLTLTDFFLSLVSS